MRYVCASCALLNGKGLVPHARKLKEMMEEYNFDELGVELGFDYEEFLKGLDFFSDSDNGLYCSKVCREGGGHPRCYIRMCAEERGVSICFECLTSPARSSSTS
ncbi:MAG: hypothetical protein DRJ43_07045 [Thermoprotei archaeon]|nr:MAG: hypothetical protein DRJ43_07045 [Thermoprotei archaeon]